MREHHQRTIAKLTELFQNDPRYPAMIIGGSIVKGREAENSDVDIMLLATNREYARCVAAQDFWYVNREICDYPSGYAEGKIIDRQYLVDTAERGNDPTRAAFVGAWVAYSRLPDLNALIARIPIYPVQEQQRKMESFYSQVLVQNWFVGEAEKRNDPYLLAQCTTELVLYAGRLILAYNQVLYPYHKWFMYEVRRAPNKPSDFVELLEQLLAQPGKATALNVMDSLKNYRDWGVTYAQAILHFTQDSEWHWRNSPSPLRDS